LVLSRELRGGGGYLGNKVREGLGEQCGEKDGEEDGGERLGWHPDHADPIGHRLCIGFPQENTRYEQMERLTGHGLTVFQCSLLHGEIEAARLCLERGPKPNPKTKPN